MRATTRSTCAGQYRSHLLIIAMLTSSISFAADIGSIELWIRAYIPDPAHSGAAGGNIVPRPNDPDHSIVKVSLADKISLDCFVTDGRGFSSSDTQTSRLETKFKILPDGMSAATVVPSANRTKAAASTKVDCDTGAQLDHKNGLVNRDQIGAPAVAEGTIQVIGQAEGTNVIPAGGFGPSIDYSFDVKWRPLTGNLTVALTYGSFPAMELYARVDSGPWTPVIQHPPSGSPWNLALDAYGVGSERNVQTATFSTLEGHWRTTDPERRFSIDVSKGVIKISEKNPTGTVLTRNADVRFNNDGTVQLNRPNDNDVLAFLGFQPTLRQEILSRGADPSFIKLSLDGQTLRADWSGLTVTKDEKAHLKEIIQPGSRPAKTFSVERAPL